MKREILCPKCAISTRKRFPTDTPYPGEHIRFVHGTALKNYICDGCTEKHYIQEGAPCTAFSIWADYGGEPYRQWEDEFIKITKPEGT